MDNKEFKLIRLYEGNTQQEHADKYGIAKVTVTKIEAGKHGIGDGTKAKVLRQFDTNDPDFKTFCERMKTSNKNK